MKRPSGFDRAPGPEPEREAPAGPEPEAGAGTEPGGDSTGRFSALLRRRLGQRPGPASSGAGPGEPGAAAAEADGEASALAAPSILDADPPAGSRLGPGSRVGDPGLAPTVDLSEVREAREAELDVSPERRSPLARLRARDDDPVRAAERRVRQAERQHRARIRRERRRFSAQARRRRRTALIVLAAIGALALFVVAGAFTPLMAVREVRVEGAAAVNEAEVAQALARFDGRPLALVDDAEVHRALEPFPLIQRYAVERVPPHTLVVRIVERVPVVSVQGDDGFAFYDAAGVLLGRGDAPPAGVPVAGGSVADLNSPAFRSAAQTLRDMPAELRAQIVSVEATSAQDVALTLASGVRVLWGDTEETAMKAVVLQRMVASLGERPIELIDVSSPHAPVFR
ncbi:FtsQ-type POTRA domain-containing protein [Leucobacter massiliensis]|uniref:Uncharacterized protein n=1 Tax=Leucobacter massiliensis TaxID=1686285 RepID=A0A2S9QQC4_9MICO|nr:FtsQ-type POTRA domain-containing protein [Leucobacter massiliensis]PRI11786.1 hypothetical protein B4915_04945 [Leucobacter massiliensis]